MDQVAKSRAIRTALSQYQGHCSKRNTIINLFVSLTSRPLWGSSWVLLGRDGLLIVNQGYSFKNIWNAKKLKK